MVRLILIGGFVVIFCMAGCAKKETAQPKAMLEEELNCPEGSLAEINGWGGVDENGWSHSCTMRHGAYHVWRNGSLAIKGEYRYGKKEGKWTFYDGEGNIYKAVTYSDGKEVNNETIKRSE